ncbi:hypothetical protein ACN47E_007023 [Coniothyrium glycines]
MAKPQIVMIPGAWHKPEEYCDKITALLSTAGYTVHARQMPAVGTPNPPRNLSADIAFAQDLVDEAIGEAGNDVVVIVHSWGGIIGGSALSGYGKETRAAQGKKGGVTALGYMTAFLLPEGMSLLDAAGNKHSPWSRLDEENNLIYAQVPEIFYNDLPEDEQKYWFDRLQSHNLSGFTTPCTAASWKELPTSYLVCEDDLAIPVSAQDGMIQGARDAGVEVDVTRIKAGHSPFLSKPEETVNWIRKVAARGSKEAGMGCGKSSDDR